MRPFLTTSTAQFLRRQPRNCPFSFDSLHNRQFLHDGTRVRKVNARRTHVNGQDAYKIPSRSLTRGSESSAGSGHMKLNPSGGTAPDPSHKGLMNGQLRIAAIKRDVSINDPEFYEELTVPISFSAAPGGDAGGLRSITKLPMFEAVLTSFLGLTLVLLGGVAYVTWYKKNVLWKMEKAFAPGYDPALEVATQSERQHAHESDEEEEHQNSRIRRKGQDLIDRIVSGKEVGHYYLLLAPKGAGKTSMFLDAMSQIDADGVSVVEAHPDLEIFRLRLGKALNYKFNEDSQMGLFQRRDPREGGAALDIERALSKLEKVALSCARKRERPLVLFFNNIQFFQRTDEGRNMILLLQQRAEAWAESGILTCVFSSDDYWPYSVMRVIASRMIPLSICDLREHEALMAARHLRSSFLHSFDCNNSQYLSYTVESDDELHEALKFVGGRLSHISRVCKAHLNTDGGLAGYAKTLIEREKGWLLSQIGLILNHDDDVKDEQRRRLCTWLLLREFVKLHKEHEEMNEGQDNSSFDLPAIPYDQAGHIMTRTDLMDDLDQKNIIFIDLDHNVRPDSMLILQAARKVVEEEGFEGLLDDVRKRIGKIESSQRTRELIFKRGSASDRTRLVVDEGGAILADK